MTNTRRAAATFWRIHLMALVILSLIISLSLRQLRSFGIETSEVARDAGPSAGYSACLGLVSSQLKRPWQWLSGAAILAVFVLAFFIPAPAGESNKIKFSADLAHLLAFPLGWLSSFIPSALKFNGNQRNFQ